MCIRDRSTSDLPVDARQLIELVVTKGNNTQLLSLLKNLPVPPVEMIKQKVVESGDAASIAEMVGYLNANPEGIGSHSILGSGQKERIVPLSEG